MNPSETVQAAQRLLAERERFGLAKYGTTVDRTDLQVGDWLQHAIEEASDLLLYLLRLQQMMPRTPDSERPTLSSLAGIAPDLMPMEEQPAPAAAPEDAERRFGPIESDPADAERNLRSKDDAERAAYLERWKDAPAEATHISEDADGTADWWLGEPVMDSGIAAGVWIGMQSARWLGSASTSILGSTRCEPRPQPLEDPERAAYLARWKDAPEWAQWLTQDVDGDCAWWETKPQRVEIQRGALWECDIGPRNQFAKGRYLLGSVRCEPRPVQGVGP